MLKTFKKYIQEAIGNKYVNHQLLTKHGYELMGDEQYHKKGRGGVKLKTGTNWISIKNPKLKGKSSTELARYLRMLDNFQIEEVNSEAQAKRLYKKYKKELERYDRMENRNIRMLPGEQSRSRELRYRMNKLKKMVGPDYKLDEKCHSSTLIKVSDKKPEVKEGMSWKPYAFRKKRKKDLVVDKEKEKQGVMKKIPVDIKFRKKNS